LQRNPAVTSSLILGSLDSGMSNKVVIFNGRSLEDMSSEFGGVAGHSDRMEGLDLDHLYFFSKNANTSVIELLLLLLEVIK